jgi:hypothetical protein
MNKKVHATPRFIFLELLDPGVYALLKGLMREFGGAGAVRRIHITVRGPYYSTITAKQVEHYQEILKRTPMLIQGAGLFENSGKFIVYIKVSSDSLNWRLAKITWSI